MYEEEPDIDIHLNEADEDQEEKETEILDPDIYTLKGRKRLKLRVGRPRKYIGGWTSVSNVLKKQIKLHREVYERWCNLKEERQHSAFATFLLDLYEFYMSNANVKIPKDFKIDQQDDVCDFSATFKKRCSSERKKLTTKAKLHVECYEDVNEYYDEIEEETEEEILEEEEEEKEDNVWSDNDENEEYQASTKEFTVEDKPPRKKRARKSQVKITDKLANLPAHKTQALPICNSTFGFSKTSQTAKKVPVLLIPHFPNTIRDRKNIQVSSATPSFQCNTASVSSVKEDTKVTLNTSANTQPIFNNPMIKPITEEGNLPAVSDRNLAEQSSQLPLTSPNIVVKSLSETNSQSFSVMSATTTTSNLQREAFDSMSVLPLHALSNSSPYFDTVNSSKVVTTQSYTQPLQVESLTNTLEKGQTPTTMNTFENTLDSTIVTSQISCKDMNSSLVNILPKDKIVSTIDLTSKVVYSDLEVAKIISGLSGSLNHVSTNFKTSPVERCHLCKKKNLRVLKVRHMATQFSTEIINSRNYFRHACTQTSSGKPNHVSVSTFTSDNVNFYRTVETQSWPSDLWSKFIIKHPEVIYNIDLVDQKELPLNYRLFRKGSEVYSSFYGTKYHIQRRPSMRCISVADFGGPEVLRLLSGLPTPVPKARQVLINVKACGVNPVDTYIRSGTYANKPRLPYTPGKDGAGYVMQVGEGVNNVKRGDRVWFFGSNTGSYAEYCICHEDNIGQLPKGISFDVGAMLGTPYMTAYRALVQKANAKQGECVLIHGATGGVGTAAVQICNHYGLKVIATAGSQEGEDLLKNMGAARVYNHRHENYIEEIKKNEERIDVVVEMLANVNLLNDLDIISHGARIVIVGSRGSIDFNPRLVMLKEAIVIGVMLAKTTPSEKREQMKFINEGLHNDWIKPILWKTLELEHAKDAHREIIKNNGAKGQIILTVNPTLNNQEYMPNTDM